MERKSKLIEKTLLSLASLDFLVNVGCSSPIKTQYLKHLSQTISPANYADKSYGESELSKVGEDISSCKLGVVDEKEIK